MTRPLVVPLSSIDTLANRLAEGLHGELGGLETRSFPDGETYLRFRTDPCGRNLVLVCSLDRPDPKFLSLVFAADAGRDLGQPASALSPRISLTCARISGFKPARP